MRSGAAAAPCAIPRKRDTLAPHRPTGVFRRGAPARARDKNRGRTFSFSRARASNARVRTPLEARPAAEFSKGARFSFSSSSSPGRARAERRVPRAAAPAACKRLARAPPPRARRPPHLIRETMGRRRGRRPRRLLQLLLMLCCTRTYCTHNRHGIHTHRRSHPGNKRTPAIRWALLSDDDERSESIDGIEMCTRPRGIDGSEAAGRIARRGVEQE